MLKKILVAYDGSEGAKLALAKAGEIAQVCRAESEVLTARRIPEYAETVSKAQKARDQAKAFYSKIIEDVSSCSRSKA